MPRSAVIRRLGDRMADVVRRVEEHEALDGISIQGFGQECLEGVPPDAYGAVAYALARKGVVWIGKSEGVELVYRRKPEAISRALTLDPIDEVMTLVAPYASVIAKSLRAEARAEGFEAIAKERGRQYESAIRIAKAIARAIQRGQDATELKSVLVEVFAEKVVGVILQHAPALHPNSRDIRITVREGKKSGSEDTEATLEEKLYHEIARHGDEGATRSDLFDHVRPRPNKDSMSEALDLLLDTSMIKATMKRGVNGLRKARHYTIAA